MRFGKQIDLDYILFIAHTNIYNRINLMRFV